MEQRIIYAGPGCAAPRRQSRRSACRYAASVGSCQASMAGDQSGTRRAALEDSGGEAGRSWLKRFDFAKEAGWLAVTAFSAS